jgi:4-amino-4-deoxy-L-arabinose transferase-like glycosyltransferase
MTSRRTHYAILAAVVAVVMLPNLGAPSLWDVDEGVNAGCTREMMESGSWIVPTFNYELRTAKPVMLYWLQRLSFNAFGINEWAARFPAVLLGLGTVLLTYELARRIFDARTALLGGVILATAIEFCKLSHAATPDAPLIFFVTLTLYLFWVGHEYGSRTWFLTAAFASGLATLTKGPLGLALPGLVVVLYLAWCGELRRFWDKRLIHGLLIWAAVAVPWYALVISETRGAYLAFFKNENLRRATSAMEGHSGPIVYYVGALFAFFAPWCVFLLGTIWFAIRKASERAPTSVGGLDLVDVRGHRFLLCWVAAFLGCFSLAATKLPNYIAPLYPAIAMLTARFLVRWQRGELTMPRWVMPAAIGGVAVVGVVITLGILIASGTIPLNSKSLRLMPPLAKWAPLGGILIVAAGVMAWQLLRNQRYEFVRTIAIASVLFVGLTAGFVVPEVDAFKAPRELVAMSDTRQPYREIRLASLDYTQPSVTFYAERKVERLANAAAADEFLRMPMPAYVFVTAKVWQEQLGSRYRVLARRYDFYRNDDVVVVTNQ